MVEKKRVSRLDARIQARWLKRDGNMNQHIRLELDRLARQIRKLPTTMGQFYGEVTCVRRSDVLELVRDAKH